MFEFALPVKYIYYIGYFTLEWPVHVSIQVIAAPNGRIHFISFWCNLEKM